MPRLLLPHCFVSRLALLLLFAASFSLLSGPAHAQQQKQGAERLPIEANRDCSSEWEARIAFGLCPDGAFSFYAAGDYRPDVPRPDSTFGYPLGSWHTTYGRMEQYLTDLEAAAPERVEVFDYGESVEQRTLHLTAVGSEETMQRLDDVRRGLQRLADPRNTSPAEAERLAADLPVVVWVNAANDGNETAAFEAAIQLAYQLAAGEDERTRRMRSETLVLINMAHNPESQARFAAFYNAFAGGDADPAALEHDAPWGMNTNNNHYQIDLNRDALALTQPETRAVAAALQRWRPQVFADLHGQTTQYFFPPNATPVNPLFPDQLDRWIETFGENNAAAFDRYGWSYYTRDVFDLFYPGYWDSYPSLHGATGMTYETDGGGGKGVRWRRGDGTVLTFKDGIAHHFVASLSTIETAAENREARLESYYDYFDSALEEGRDDRMQSVVLPVTEGKEPAAVRLATTLLRHGITVRRTTAAGDVTGHGYLDGGGGDDDETERRVPAGSFVVDLAQPNYRLAKMLLAPEIPLPEGFRQQELARYARNLRLAPQEREGHAFYDVTSWNLPLAFHATEAFWTEERAELPSEPVRSPEDVSQVSGGTDGRARSAYVWRPSGTGAVQLLARLQGEDFNVAVSRRPLVVADEEFPRGSYVARVNRNPDALHERIDALAREAGVDVRAAATAYPERGPTGTGSEAVRNLRPPRIGVLAGEGVSTTSYGALWYFLERRIHQSFTALRAEDLAGVNLRRFDVMILPDGGYDPLGERATDKLEGWVERGGALIGYAGGARFLTAEGFADYAAPDTGALPPDTVRALRRRADARLSGATPENLPPAPSRAARPGHPLAVPGAFLRAQFDGGHWLTFGYDERELALLSTNRPLRPTRNGATPVRYVDAGRETLEVSGFTWPDNTRRTYAGAPYATVDAVGDGRVIRLAEDPVFRLVYDGPAQLLTNAIYLGARGRSSSSAY